MLELIFAGVVVASVAKIARNDGRPERRWAAIAAGLCAASLLLPLPFVRLGLAFVATIVAMMMQDKSP